MIFTPQIDFQGLFFFRRTNLLTSENMCHLSCSLNKIPYAHRAKNSAAQIESFHQEGTVNVKVCESDFVSLWDGTNDASFTCRTQASEEHISLK